LILVVVRPQPSIVSEEAQPQTATKERQSKYQDRAS
jgi:hypothetical protein